MKRKMAAPAIVGQKVDASNALRVGPSQIEAANEFAQSVGCGTPFEADGKPRLTRAVKAKLMRAYNERREDLGQARFVNFDGGYGDET